jgi:hypothetical protein
MSFRSRVTRSYNITVDEVIHAYEMIRDAVKAGSWLRNRYRAKNPLDKWAMKAAAVIMGIAGLPGLLLGVLAAVTLTNNSVPPVTSPYYNYYMLTFAMIVAFVTTIYYGMVGRRLFKMLEKTRALAYPYDYVRSSLRVN